MHVITQRSYSVKSITEKLASVEGREPDGSRGKRAGDLRIGYRWGITRDPLRLYQRDLSDSNLSFRSLSQEDQRVFHLELVARSVV